MDATQQPIDVSGAEYEKFLVFSRPEVVYILHGLMEKFAMVTAVFSQGRNHILTAVLDVQGDWVILDYGTDERLDEKILTAGRIIFVTALERIRIQFNASHIERIEYHGAPAFRIPVPESVLRLQRREYFRITTPIAQPVEAQLLVEPGRWLKVKVVDIGVGGIGLMETPKDVNSTPGMRYRAKVLLPDATIECDVRMRYGIEVGLRNGRSTRRCGAQFIDLPGKQQVLVQRYIIGIERERRARLLADDQ